MSATPVLYVAHLKTNMDVFCPGSAICIDMCKRTDIEINIQDVDVLRQKNVGLPGWMDGTPILIERGREPIKGGNAVARIQEMIEQFPKSNNQLPPSDLADDDNADPFVFNASKNGGLIRDNKLTDEDLQKYMDTRKQYNPVNVDMQ